MSTMLINKEYVPRHEKAFAVCHWLNAFAFFMLFLTALPLYADTFRFMYDIFGDKTLMYAHRVFCFAAALGHIYLAAGVNPDSLHGMVDGTIKASYAAHHHGAWVNELVAEGVVTREEIEQAEKADHH